MKLTATTRLLLLFLAGAPKSYVDLLAYLEIHPNTLTKLLKSLTRASIVTHDRATNTYSLTPATARSDSSTPVPSTPLTA